ncbi:MAG: phosphoserine phosphatase SerB [Erythrobacter sp.]
MLIARLIADPAALETSVEKAIAALEAHGMPIAMARPLEHHADALHLSLPEGDEKALLEVLDEHFGPSDVLTARAEIAVPNLFVSDMDSTMIGQECIDELADYAGLKDKIADITERAMQGELDFESALRERVGLLAGLDESAIGQCLAERITAMPGAKTLVQTLKSKGCRTVLVTGGFHHFADAVAAQIGFDRVVGNRLDVAEGKLTGALVGRITDSSVKKAVLHEELEQLDTNAVSLATGDGANDIPMLEAADYGLAYRAKPIARKAANGWVDFGDLTAILKLMDIPEEEWVRG